MDSAVPQLPIAILSKSFACFHWLAESWHYKQPQMNRAGPTCSICAVGHEHYMHGQGKVLLVSSSYCQHRPVHCHDRCMLCQALQQSVHCHSTNYISNHCCCGAVSVSLLMLMIAAVWIPGCQPRWCSVTVRSTFLTQADKSLASRALTACRVCQGV